MTNEPGYKAYADDEQHMERYRAYQARYATKIRESDKVLLEWIRSTAPAAGSLLDIGCSTGNLLIHLRHQLPGLQLAGADLSESTIEANKRNADLAGVAFDVMDVVKSVTGTYDVVTCNAIFFSLDDAELATALANLRRALKPGGQLFAFDWFHPHDDQHLTIIERSREFAHGLRITARPENQMRAAMIGAGFTSAEFRPFYMPIDLPRPREANDVTSYTVLADAQRRLSFRGALYQPWSHMRGVA